MSDKIVLYQETGWVNIIRGLSSFGITPEIRAQGTISKGYSLSEHPHIVSLDYFLVHMEPEPLKNTVTLPKLLECYHVKQEDLKCLSVSIPSPDLCIKAGRVKYGKKSGVLCSSDDNITGIPLMDLKSGDILLYQGAVQNCKECPFKQDDTCKETVLVLFTILAPTDKDSNPFGNMLFKMTLPRTARNPFFGNYALAMTESHHTLMRYGLDQHRVPQSMIPFQLSLVKRNGQYFNEKKKSQVKTSYYVPQLLLDSERLRERLERLTRRALVGKAPISIQEGHEEEDVDLFGAEPKPSIPSQYKTLIAKGDAIVQRIGKKRFTFKEKQVTIQERWENAKQEGFQNGNLHDMVEWLSKKEKDFLEKTSKKGPDECPELRQEILSQWDQQDYHREHRWNSLKKHFGKECIEDCQVKTPEDALDRFNREMLNSYLDHLKTAEEKEK